MTLTTEMGLPVPPPILSGVPRKVTGVGSLLRSGMLEKGLLCLLPTVPQTEVQEVGWK